MIYNVHNEIVCDFNCKDCKDKSYCTDRIDTKEEKDS